MWTPRYKDALENPGALLRFPAQRSYRRPRDGSSPNPALRSHWRKWSVSSGWTWKKKTKTPPNMGEAIRSNNCVQSQGGGRVWTNNHKQHCSWNLIKLLMTCHSRALQMFIDAHYQPHSSSVRAAALAAMSPTTPTHLVLPPHTGRGGGLGEGQKRSTSFQDADGGCWAVTPCFLRNQQRGQLCDYLFIRSPPTTPARPPPFTPSCLGHGATPLPSHCPLFLSHLRCGSSHFLAVTSSAFTLTRDTHDKLGVEVKVMACESNAPASSLHTVDIYTKAGWHADTWLLRVCVRNLTLGALGRPARPLRQSGR